MTKWILMNGGKQIIVKGTKINYKQKEKWNDTTSNESLQGNEWNEWISSEKCSSSRIVCI